MNHFTSPKINEKTYSWSVRAFSSVKRMLGVNIKLHAPDHQVEEGHIFLFNHFSRFETFIPQYLIYQEQKTYCRSVASSEFFEGDDRFTTYLHAVGAVSNSTPDLLPLLARDILQGHKVIIFPEGGMVKDKRIMSSDGKLSIYSPTSEERRKHHTGAARLALILDIYKTFVMRAHKKNDKETLQNCCLDVGIDSIDTLIERCKIPTRIIPSNITFYPIRIQSNFLKESVERFTEKLHKNFAEELMIEGNLVLKDTDMDIRMGHAIETKKYWAWLDRIALKRAVKDITDLDTLFNIGRNKLGYLEQIAAQRLRTKTDEIRDDAMTEMYSLVTLNLSHLASALIIRLIDEGVGRISLVTFLRIIYLSARYISHEKNIHLHRSLLSPETYRDLRDGSSKEFQQFLRSTQFAQLIKVDDLEVSFLPKLKQEHDFHDIRLENPICVYANECASIEGVNAALDRALSNHTTISNKQWSQFFFEDEKNAYDHAKDKFHAFEYEDINAQQTATKDGAPFFLTPKGEIKRKSSILLVHGFLASPYEMRGLGDDLANLGYPVYGTRLEGHGTSPCDLRDRSWQGWLRSVKRGYDVLASCSDHIIMVGFSTGGALSILFGAERPDKLAGICAISTPLKFKNPNLVFIPLIHHANRLAKWLAAQEGVLPYIINDSEHPDINYRHIPIRALHELRLLVDEMEKNLSRLNCPTLLIQGDHDTVVNPNSAALIRDQMVAATPKIIMVPSERHGIVTENIAGTRQHIIDFVHHIDGGLENDPE